MTQTTRQTYRLCYVGRSSAQIARDYGERLDRLRHEGFEVVVFAGDDGGFGPLAELGVSARPIPTPALWNPAALFGAFVIMQAAFIETTPVLVHGFDGALAWAAALAARRAEVPAVVVSVDRHPFVAEPLRFEADELGRLAPRAARAVESLLNQLGARAGRAGMRRVYEWLGGQADRYLVSSEHDLQVLQDEGLVAPAKLEMVIGGRGVALDEFEVLADDFPTVTQARATLGVPAGWRRVLGFHGPLVLGAGADDLVELVEDVATTHPAAGWLVWSDDDGAPGVRAQLERLEAAGRVRFVSPEAPAVYYRALDLLVAPGYRPERAEALMAAAATKVGAVAYATPVAASIVVDTQSGRLVPVGDVDALAAAVRAGLDDPGRMANWGARARARAEQRFARRLVTDQVLRVYDTVLEIKLRP